MVTITCRYLKSNINALQAICDKLQLNINNGN